MENSSRERVVQVIPAIPRVGSIQGFDSPIVRKRVAAYARVSTDMDEQLNSYEAQIDFYTQKIKSNPDWEFIEVYTDKGISGTNTKRREGFNRMINDALAGKIDLILTKSVSRFARNTVDTLTTIRQLKEHGVAVHFEEQGIDTMDGKGELLITIMSSIAQEESRNISENVTWGKRKSAADGKISLAYKHFLGYEKGEDGLPKIVEEQAKIVRLIYRSYLEGKSAHQIAILLTKMGVPSPAGRKKWQDTTVMSILTNEKYRGSAKLQKTYTIAFLQKKKKVNEGEVQQYYIEHSHDAIVAPTEFERVQLEIHRREAAGDHGASTYTFSSRIVCGECGAYYGRKVWHSNDDRYRRAIWRCNAKYKGSAPCRTTHLTEEEIKSHFIHAFNQLQAVREDTIEACRESISALCDLTELDAKIIGLREEISALSARAEQLAQSIANGTIEAADHAARSAAIAEKLAPADAELKRLQAERFRLVDLRRSLEYFMDGLSEQEEMITEFNDALFLATIDTVAVHSSKRLVFHFRDGTEISESIAD